MSRLLVATTRSVESFCQRPELPSSSSSSSSPLPLPSPPPHPDIPRLWLPNVDFSQSSETPRRPDGISEPPGTRRKLRHSRSSSRVERAISLLLSNSHNHFIHNPVPGSPSLKSQPSVRSQASENLEPRVDLMPVFIRDPPKSNQESISPRSHHASPGSVPEVSRSRGRCYIYHEPYYSLGLADRALTRGNCPQRRLPGVQG
jgi:hypothetical protein